MHVTSESACSAARPFLQAANYTRILIYSQTLVTYMKEEETKKLQRDCSFALACGACADHMAIL